MIVTDKKHVLLEYECEACGARFVSHPQTNPAGCAYCAHPLALIGDADVAALPPRVLPFLKTKADIASAFAQKHKEFPLLAQPHLTDENTVSIAALYLPVRFYAGKICLASKGIAIEASEPALDIKGCVEKYSIKVDYFFESAPANMAPQMQDAWLEAICPFDVTDDMELEAEHLLDLLAEKPATTSESEACASMYNKAENTALIELDNTVYCSDEVRRAEKEAVKIEWETPQYCLVPVYVITLELKGARAVFLMNGQTGTIAGDFTSDAASVRAAQMKRVCVQFVLFLPLFLWVGVAFAALQPLFVAGELSHQIIIFFCAPVLVGAVILGNCIRGIRATHERKF